MGNKLYLPNGDPALTTDPIMVFNKWVRYFKKLGKTTLSAYMGKPTYPMPSIIPKELLLYWMKKYGIALLTQLPLLPKLIELDATIPYDDTQGNEKARQKMVRALTKWYNQAIEFKPEHILFTVGDAGALSIIFKFLDQKNPNGLILTPVPHYSLYANEGGKNKLHPIDVMQNNGFKLTAEAVEMSICAASARQSLDKKTISAFLFCYPHNPTGTTVDFKEWQKIAEVIKRHLKIYPETLIILDEVYAELQFSGMSLLQAAPELANNIILLRSATKGLSTPGERQAIAVAFNQATMTQLNRISIQTYGHAPTSLQLAYAHALKKLASDTAELAEMKRYYFKKIEYVQQRLSEMGAALPDPSYQISGSFYILADFSDFIGLPLHPDVIKQVYKGNHSGTIQTDEDIAYHLLFDGQLGIAPLSYFIHSDVALSLAHLRKAPNLGYMRITCSDDEKQLKELMDSLEHYLYQARLAKFNILTGSFPVKAAPDIISISPNTDFRFATDLECMPLLPRYRHIHTKSALELKEINAHLSQRVSDNRVAKLTAEQAAIKIQNLFRGYRARKTAKNLSKEMAAEWFHWVDKHYELDRDRQHMYSHTPTERLQISFWKRYLKKKAMKQNPPNVVNADSTSNKPAGVQTNVH